MSLKILKRRPVTDAVLGTKARAVPLRLITASSFQLLIRRMLYTMRRTHGVGLAAPQIGKPWRLAVIEVRPTPLRPSLKALPATVIINPTIVAYSKEKTYGWEGCLSFMKFRGFVPRSRWIKVRFWDEQGRKHVSIYRGFSARVFQHEIDHLSGRLYLYRLTQARHLITLSAFKRQLIKSRKKGS